MLIGLPECLWVVDFGGGTGLMLWDTVLPLGLPIPTELPKCMWLLDFGVDAMGFGVVSRTFEVAGEGGLMSKGFGC